MFEWNPVESKAMQAIGYDSEASTIYVRFDDRREHWYSDCPPDVWEQFCAPSQSKGTFLNQVLKKKPNGRRAS